MATDSIADSPRIVRAERASSSLSSGWTLYDQRGITVPIYDGAMYAALREYFTRPKVPTPQQRAWHITDAWSKTSLDGEPIHHRVELDRMIAAAIEDAARRGVDWTEE